MVSKPKEGGRAHRYVGVVGEDPETFGRVDFAFPELSGTGAEQQANLLRKALAESKLERILGMGVEARLVRPGDELASVCPGSSCPATPTLLRAGLNVGIADNHYVAQSWGYLRLDGDTLSVMNPVWISPDKMRCYFILFPQTDWSPPDSAWIMELLELEGVRHGIQETALERLSRHRVESSQAAAFLLAEGTAPIDGEDAHVDYGFDPHKRAGTFRPDGSIDLKERNAAVGVSADQFLGEFVPEARGRTGMNVFGEEIDARDGDPWTLRTGANVRRADEADVVRYYAEIDGAADVTDDVLRVLPILHVHGDVDYGTGNIDVAKDVQITGSVRPGFTVKAGGSISVAGMVESGAVLQAKGDIVVGGGIVGETTRVVAFGDIRTRYIQHSEVLAQGSVTVGSYAFNARVRAGGRIEVKSLGGKRGGSIVGGEALAAESIVARQVGSSSAHTRIGIVPVPGSVARLAKLGKFIDQCEADSLRLLRTLNVGRLGIDGIRTLIRRAPPARRQPLIESLKKLRELGRVQQEARAKQELLRSEISRFRDGRVEVTGTVRSGVRIVFGDDVHSVSDDMSALVFFRGPNGVSMRPIRRRES